MSPPHVIVVAVAWDWVNQKLYWTDTTAGDIEVYDPETTHRRVLYSGSADSIINPTGLVVDPATGYDVIHKIYGYVIHKDICGSHR